MSEHTLPDDCLAVARQPVRAARRRARRQRARPAPGLRPPHPHLQARAFPEQFRRIRAAYEAVQGYAPFYTTFEAPADPPAPPAESRPAERPPSEVPEADSPDAPAAERTRPRCRARWRKSWTRPGTGPSTATRRGPMRACSNCTTGIRGAPKPASGCTACSASPRSWTTGGRPCDFLAEGLRQAGGGGPCHELYRREIEDDPAEALTGPLRRAAPRRRPSPDCSRPSSSGVGAPRAG